MKTNKNILSPETEDILMQFGIHMDIIRKVQHAYIKDEVISKLEKLTNHIKNDEYGDAQAMFSISSGKESGSPTHFINCKDIFPPSEGIKDIYDVINKLSNLLYITSEDLL